jgi:hypothetical protein
MVPRPLVDRRDLRMGPGLRVVFRLIGEGLDRCAVVEASEAGSVVGVDEGVNEGVASGASS